MTRLLVDDRYRGAHGIGRYAREVVERLRPEWRSLRLSGSPHTALDAFRALPGLRGDAVVYSPGYGALVRAPRQVLTIHDLIQLRAPWPERAKFAAYYAGPVRHAVRAAGVVLTVSDTSARAIREWVRDDTVRIVNAGNGVSSAFRPDGPAASTGAPYVVFVGNTRPHKNLDVVMRALVGAPEIRLVAVVPAGEAAAVHARASALAVAERVEVTSGVDDALLAEIYRGAAATVMPSTLEGFGLPALESIASGVPVIHWRGCEAVGEIVGDRGWAMESAHEAEEWTVALLHAARSGRRVDQSSGAYDWDRTTGIVSDTLESVLG